MEKFIDQFRTKLFSHQILYRAKEVDFLINTYKAQSADEDKLLT